MGQHMQAATTLATRLAIHLRRIGYNYTQEATINFKLQQKTDQLYCYSRIIDQKVRKPA